MNGNVFDALYSLYDAASTLKTLTGGQWEYSKAPDTWSDNFAIVQPLSAEPDNAFRTALDDLGFQINVFSTARDTCWSMLSAAVSLFDGKILTITGHYPSRISRENQVPPIWNEQDNLWQATAEFSIMLQQT